MIGVILSTRGLYFAEVWKSLLENLEGHNWKPYQAIGLPIPDCQNVPTEEALRDGCSHLWYVEEDTVPPKGALDKLLNAEGDISAIDYGVNGWACIARDKIDCEIKWCGLGCTLVKSYVFDKLEKPYFRDDMQLMVNRSRPDFMTWVKAPENRYGGQDIWFCSKAREAGFKIVQVQGECRHLKLESLGGTEINKGSHIIVDKPKIEKFQFI
jgi:hypothetical protein